MKHRISRHNVKGNKELTSEQRVVRAILYLDETKQKYKCLVCEKGLFHSSISAKMQQDVRVSAHQVFVETRHTEIIEFISSESLGIKYSNAKVQYQEVANVPFKLEGWMGNKS